MSGNPAAAAFMAAFDAGTAPHPFTGAFRIWAGRVVFEVKPLNRAMWRADVSLSAIQALEPGNGDGSRALDWFLGLAREHGAIVTGNVQRIGKTGLTVGQLRAWYKRHGFTVARNGDLRFDPAK